MGKYVDDGGVPNIRLPDFPSVNKSMKSPRGGYDTDTDDEVVFEKSNLDMGEVIAVAKLREYDASIRRRNIFMLFLSFLAIIFFAFQIWLAYSKKICFEGFDPTIAGPIDGRYKTNCTIRDSRTNALKIVISVITFIHITTLFFYYRYQIERERKSHWFIRDSMIWSDHAWKIFFLEAAILLIHPFPTGTKRIYDDKLGALMFVRFYQFIRVLRDHSPIYKERRKLLRDNHLKKLGAVEFNWLLSVKYLFLQNTWLFVILGVILTWFSMTYCIWITEREHNYNFTLLVSMWMTCITMTTVGYGDVFPTNTSAQIITAFTAILGIINTSLIVYAVTMTLTLTDSEKNIRNMMVRKKYSVEHQRAAAKYISLHFSLFKWKVKKGLSSVNLSEKTVKLSKEDMKKREIMIENLKKTREYKDIIKQFNRENAQMKGYLRECRRNLSLAMSLDDIVIDRLQNNMPSILNKIGDAVAVDLGFYPSQRKKTANTLLSLHEKVVAIERETVVMVEGMDSVLRLLLKEIKPKKKN